MEENFRGVGFRAFPKPVGDDHFGIPDLSKATLRVIEDTHDWSGNLLKDVVGYNEVFEIGGHGLVFRFQLNGSTGNKIILHNCENISGSIDIAGSDSVIMLCGNCPWPSRINIHMYGNRSSVFVGAGSTFVGATFFPTGDDISIVVGNDCMFSHETMVRTYDQHAIFDLETKEWVNKPASVLIGPHVWIGQETLILKGASIGERSVVGARSTVNSPIAPSSLCVGSPARVIRANISWIRHLHPDEQRMEDIIKSYGNR